jgi:hypothetical protein
MAPYIFIHVFCKFIRYVPPEVNFGTCLNIKYVVSLATKCSLAPKHVHCNAIQKKFKYLRQLQT